MSKAELWIHKEKDPLDEHNQTFVISEVAHWDTNKSFQKTKPIAIQETNIKGRKISKHTSGKNFRKLINNEILQKDG